MFIRINSIEYKHYTMAQTTTIVEQKQEVGGNYILPRNLEEAARMQNQHEWLKGGAEGLVLAPIDRNGPPLRVLDSATADGMYPGLL